MSRSIIVDDTDSAITYAGAWFTDTGSFDNTGNSGPPFQSTLHGTNSAASFSYAFNGSSVVIVGTNEFSTNSSTFLSWQCIVDNENIPVIQTQPPAANRVPFCRKDGLADGRHTIFVNAMVSNQQTFLFDYIQYVPSASVPLDQVSISVNSTDPQLIYSGQWQRSANGSSTIQDGATLSFYFTGMSLYWFGFFALNAPFAFTTASYSIDGQDFIDFPLNAESPLAKDNQLFFKTAQLPAGQHNITLIYHGNNFTTPLTLESLVIQNNVSTTTAASPTPSASLPATGISGHKSKHSGAIAGGVVGGVALIVLAVLLLLFLRRRIRGSNGQTAEPADSPSIVRPFNHAPTTVDPVKEKISPMSETPAISSLLSAQSEPHGPDLEGQDRRPDPTDVVFQLPLLNTTHLSPPQVQTFASPARLVAQDEDSGIRIDQHGNPVEVLPPAYTSG
ncbi:hypothetical protein BDZ97DRAFT_1919114 [Flammula alnicola]|nr:hypothetical protein BDZ97DRAFT_1919114 [Flammula alnicola]